jgi:7-cyano-7-deazaguanine synthase in queuosine biosynthesis
VDYGQRNASVELAVSRYQTSLASSIYNRNDDPSSPSPIRCHPLVVMDMSAIGQIFRQYGSKNAQLYVPIPHRNLPLLSLAVSFATQQQCHQIVLGVNAEDGKDYASAQTPFLSSFASMLTALEPLPHRRLSLSLPLLQPKPLTKADVIHSTRMTLPHVNLAKTFTCMTGPTPSPTLVDDTLSILKSNDNNGYIQHCGTCYQCKRRRLAFQQAQVEEPNGFYRTSYKA